MRSRLSHHGLLIMGSLLVAALLPPACNSNSQVPRNQPTPTRTAETVVSDGIITTIAGRGNPFMTKLAVGVPVDPLQTDIGTPWESRLDRHGTLWIGTFVDLFLRMRADGKIETILNKDSVIGGVKLSDGAKNAARLTVFDFLPPDDDLILPDMNSQRVYRIPKSGGDYDLSKGSVIDFGSIKVERPSSARVFRGKIYVASADDTLNGPGQSYIVEFDPATGISRIVAGNGQPGYTGDGGAAREAKINPIDIDFRSDGLLVIADNSSTLRVVNLNDSGTLDIYGTRVPAGTIQTICGKNSNRYTDAELVGIPDDARTGGNFKAYAYRYARVSFNTGDEGPATEATIDWPFGPRFDSEGRLHFVDSDNHRLRIIDKFGVIHTVAGNSGPDDQGQLLIGSPGGLKPPLSMSGRDASGVDDCRKNVCPFYPKMFTYPDPVPSQACGCFTIPINDNAPGRQTILYHPMGLGMVERGNNTFDYFIPDTDNARVRKLTGVQLSG